MKGIGTYVAPAYLAGALFALPYAVLLSLIVVPLAGIDAPPSVVYKPSLGAFALFAFGFDAVLALVPGAFFVVARIGWRRRTAVVSEYLYGWPVGLAVLALFGIGAFLHHIGRSWATPAILGAISIGLLGVLGSRIWLWLAYREGIEPNQPTGPTADAAAHQ